MLFAGTFHQAQTLKLGGVPHQHKNDEIVPDENEIVLFLNEFEALICGFFSLVEVSINREKITYLLNFHVENHYLYFIFHIWIGKKIQYYSEFRKYFGS